jgi:hypothetical protein
MGYTRFNALLFPGYLMTPSASTVYYHELGVRDYRRDMYWKLDLSTPRTHHSELEVITTLPLISTLHKWLQHPLCLFQSAVSSTDVPWQRLQTVEILQLPALRSSCHSLPCITHCQFPQLPAINLTYRHLFSAPLQSSILDCQPSTLSQLFSHPTAISKD